MKIKHTLNDVSSVLSFICILFTIAILGAFIDHMIIGESYLSMVFIEQITIYLMILAVGMILCFTDLILRTRSTKLRIAIVSLTIYVVSLLYFKQCAINPLKSALIFLLYTVVFAGATYIISIMFITYQNHKKNKYSEFISKYQEKNK